MVFEAHPAFLEIPAGTDSWALRATMAVLASQAPLALKVTEVHLAKMDETVSKARGVGQELLVGPAPLE